MSVRLLGQSFFTKRFRHFKNMSQAKTNQQSVHKNFREEEKGNKKKKTVATM